MSRPLEKLKLKRRRPRSMWNTTSLGRLLGQRALLILIDCFRNGIGLSLPPITLSNRPTPTPAYAKGGRPPLDGWSTARRLSTLRRVGIDRYVAVARLMNAAITLLTLSGQSPVASRYNTLSGCTLQKRSLFGGVGRDPFTSAALVLRELCERRLLLRLNSTPLSQGVGWCARYLRVIASLCRFGVTQA